MAGLTKSIYIPEELEREILVQAERERRTFSQMVVLLVEQGLKVRVTTDDGVGLRDATEVPAAMGIDKAKDILKQFNLDGG